MPFFATTKDKPSNDVLYMWTDSFGVTTVTNDEEEAMLAAVVPKYTVYRTSISWQQVAPMLVMQ
jgi:hypothetical protein